MLFALLATQFTDFVGLLVDCIKTIWGCLLKRVAQTTPLCTPELSSVKKENTALSPLTKLLSLFIDKEKQFFFCGPGSGRPATNFCKMSNISEPIEPSWKFNRTCQPDPGRGAKHQSLEWERGCRCSGWNARPFCERVSALDRQATSAQEKQLSISTNVLKTSIALGWFAKELFINNFLNDAPSTFYVIYK